MTIQSGFFNSINGDRKYSATNFAEYFASFIGNGVFPNPSTGFQVVEDENMNIVVKAGKGWINGYFVVNDSDYTLTLDNADGVLKRIDRVVMRLNYVTRQIEIVVKKGAFASNPVAPTLQRGTEFHELGLADILINNGATVIAQTNITDTRFNSSLCGIVKGLIDEIDTTNLFAQYDAAFKEWFETIETYLDGDVAANLTLAIGRLENSTEEHYKNFTNHVNYVVSSGTADNYNVTLPGLANYIDGLAIAVKINESNTGAASININGLGNVPIKKSANKDLVIDDLKADGIYTFRYNGVNFLLQGEGGGYSVSDAITEDALKLVESEGVEKWISSEVKSSVRMTIDKNKNIYIAQSNAISLQVFDSNGNFIKSLSDIGYATDVRVDNYLYRSFIVYGENTKTVQKADMSGNEIWSKTDVGHCRAIYVDSSENVYCAHDVAIGYKSVRKLSPNGDEIWSITNQQNANDIIVDNNGNVYVAFRTNVANGYKIAKYSPSGVLLWGFTDSNYAERLAIDSEGNVYVTYFSATKHLVKLDPNGNEIWSINDSRYANPSSVVVDKADNVIITKYSPSGGYYISKFDKNGNFLYQNINTPYIRDIKLDDDGYAYITTYRSSVERAVKLSVQKKYEITR